MPNWCSTNIEFSGPEKDIKKLYEFIDNKNGERDPNIETDFGARWLGYYLLRVGLSDERYNCRGTVADLSKISTTDNAFEFKIWTETAWGPMIQMWLAIIKKLELNSIQVSYSAVEPGCEVYQTNDPEQAKLYVVDLYDEDEVDKKIVDALGFDDFQDVTEEQLREGLLEVFPGEDNLSTEALIKKLDELTGDDGINICKWSYVPAEEQG